MYCGRQPEQCRSLMIDTCAVEYIGRSAGLEAAATLERYCTLLSTVCLSVNASIDITVDTFNDN